MIRDSGKTTQKADEEVQAAPPAAAPPLQEPSLKAVANNDVDPATLPANDEDEEASLPERLEDADELVGEGPLATGRAAIAKAVRHAPKSPGVYRMLSAGGDVLYVGKAKDVSKRL